MLQIDLPTEHATEILARDCVALCPPHATILLKGDLAAGKTVFARAFIRALMQDPSYVVASPTFQLVQIHETMSGPVYHYDLYRIDDADELLELDLDAGAAARATLIEWPERLGDIEKNLRQVIRIELVVTGANSRRAQIDFGDVLKSPDTAFIFAAGLGARMRPLTDTVPKPLVPVASRPILTYAFDTLQQSGISRVVMNTHYHPDQINAFAASQRRYFDIEISHENELLETGGGLVRALPAMARDTFFALNGDALILDTPGALPYITHLAARFDPDQMDILLLLYPVDAKTVTPLVGDYDLDPATGRLTRALHQQGKYMFMGARILHARVLRDLAPTRFSFLTLMDQAQKEGRLFGIVHTGTWHHLSTPEDVRIVSRVLEQEKRDNAA